MADKTDPADDAVLAEAMACEAEADDMDRAFRDDDCVPIEFDSDDDAPQDSEIEGEMAEEKEEGIIKESDVYGDAIGIDSDVDDSVARLNHADSVLSVAFCPTDRRVLATGGQDDLAVLWAIEETSGALHCVERHRLSGHTDSISQVAFSHDGKYVATGSYDGTVKVWIPESGKLSCTLDGPSKEVEWIMWHPKGHALLGGSADTMAWMWWVPTGKLMQVFAAHAQSVTCGCWGLGGKLIVTGSDDHSVIVWNPRAASPVHHIREAHEASVVCMCSHPEAPIIVCGSEDSTAKVIQIENGRVVATLGGHEHSVECVGFNNPLDGGMSLLATGSMDGKIQIWDGKTFDLRCVIRDHVEQGGIVRFKWSPASAFSSLLASCSTDGTVRVFEALAGKCLQTFRGHTDIVVDLDVALGDAGAAGPQLAIASGAEDNTGRIFLTSVGGSTQEA